jgi:hypothetical protein
VAFDTAANADELVSGGGHYIFWNGRSGDDLFQVGDGFDVVFQGRIGKGAIEQGSSPDDRTGALGIQDLVVDVEGFVWTIGMGVIHALLETIVVAPGAREQIQELAEETHDESALEMKAKLPREPWEGKRKLRGFAASPIQTGDY